MSKMASHYCRAVVLDECEFNRIAIARILRSLPNVETVIELPSLESDLRSTPDTSLDVLVFNLDPASSAEFRVEEVKLCYPKALHILVASARDSKAIQACLFAGVDGYIPLQLPAPAFRSALKDVLSKGKFGTRALAHPPQVTVSGANAQRPAPLTPRQREIVTHLSRGRTGKEIGRELDLASGTVRSHLHKIYRRAGVHHRIDMMRALAGLGRGEFGVEPALLRHIDSRA